MYVIVCWEDPNVTRVGPIILESMSVHGFGSLSGKGGSCVRGYDEALGGNKFLAGGKLFLGISKLLKVLELGCLSLFWMLV